MNIFRYVFLLLSLICGGLLALVQLAPPVFESEARRTLFDLAQAEVRTLWQAEQLAAAERELLATDIASSAALLAVVEPPIGTAEPVTPTRIATTFQTVADEALRAHRTPFTMLTLVGPDGSNLVPQQERGLLSIEELVSEALVQEAVEGRKVVHRAFTIGGQLFVSVVVPVRGAGGAVPAAVVLVHRYDDVVATQHRLNPDAHIVYFAQLDIVASTIADPALRERALAFVRRVNEARLAGPGDGGVPETDRFQPTLETAMGDGSDRMIAMVPVSLAIGNSSQSGALDLAALVVVEGKWPPGSLMSYIVRGNGLDQGTMTLWTFLAGALAMFFILLFIHDAFLGLALEKLGAAIEANAQSNSPHALDAKQHPAWLRPLVARVNLLLEEFRSRATAARRAREEAETYKERVEAVTGSVPAIGNPPREGQATGQVPAIPSTFRSEPFADAPRPGPIGLAKTEALPSLQSPFPPTASEDDPSLPMVPSGSYEAAPAEESYSRKSAQSVELPAVGGSVRARTASGSLPATPQPPIAPIVPDAFDEESSSVNRVAEAFLAKQPRLATPVDSDAVSRSAADLDALFEEGSSDEVQEAQQDAPTAIAPSPFDQHQTVAAALSRALEQPAQPPISRPMPAVSGDRTPAAGAPGASSDAVSTERPAPVGPPPVRPMTGRNPALTPVVPPPASGAARAAATTAPAPTAPPALPRPTPTLPRPIAVTDAAGQQVVSTTEQSGVSQLIDSIMAPSAASITVERDPARQPAPSASWPHAVPSLPPEDPNAITSPPHAPDASLLRGLSANLPQGEGMASMSGFGQRPTVPDVATLPEPSDFEDAGAEMTPELAAAFDALGAQPVSRILRTVPPAGDQTGPPVQPAMPAQPAAPALGSAPAASAARPDVTNADALFARAEERMRQMSSFGQNPSEDEATLRSLYEQFRAAREACNENVIDLTFEKFTTKLDKSREQLKQRYNTTRIDFSVDIVDGKATLKAKPYRGE